MENNEEMIAGLIRKPIGEIDRQSAAQVIVSSLGIIAGVAVAHRAGYVLLTALGTKALDERLEEYTILLKEEIGRSLGDPAIQTIRDAVEKYNRF